MGGALVKILREVVPDLMPTGSASYAAAFARACAHWEVALQDTLHAYAWSWSENQVLTAVKLVPLGQSAGQRILHELIPLLAQVVDHALQMGDDDISYCSIMQSVASARHENQYTRLFRS
jgi:urease accessory protein